VTNDKSSQSRAKAKQNEPIFFIRMIRISNQKCAVIQEYALGFFEGDAMFPCVLFGFSRIPDKPQFTH